MPPYLSSIFWNTTDQTLICRSSLEKGDVSVTVTNPVTLKEYHWSVAPTLGTLSVEIRHSVLQRVTERENPPVTRKKKIRRYGRSGA